MLTAVEDATAKVVTVKVLVLVPAATVTLAGTVAAAVLLLDKVTTAPPVGAGSARLTVAVDGTPPSTLVGLSTTAKAGDPVPVKFTV